MLSFSSDVGLQPSFDSLVNATLFHISLHVIIIIIIIIIKRELL